MTTLRDGQSGLSLRACWAGFKLCAVLVLGAVTLTGCASLNPVRWLAARPAPSVTTAMTPATVTDAARASTAYERDPKSIKAAITYARALRELGSNEMAANVLARTAQYHPDSGELVSEYAKALTAAGRNEEALVVFKRAESLNRSDWSLLSAEGIALDQLGRHRAARERYNAALKLSPNNPDVMCNLAFSYTLSGNLEAAEVILRRAVTQPGASPAVRQNLAMVVGLQGHFSEAKSLSRADLDPATADHNVAVLKDLFAQPELWTEAKEAKAGPKVASSDARRLPVGDVSVNPATVNGVHAVPVGAVDSAALPAAGRVQPSGITAAIPSKTKSAVPPRAPQSTPQRTHHAPPSAQSHAVGPAKQYAEGNGIDDTFFPFGW